MKFHTDILDLIRETIKIFNLMNFAQILTTLACLVVLLIQIKVAVEFSSLLPIIGVILACLTQFFAYCFLGEQISILVTKFYMKLLKISIISNSKINSTVWKATNIALFIKLASNQKHFVKKENFIHADDDTKDKALHSRWNIEHELSDVRRSCCKCVSIADIHTELFVIIY